MSTAPSRSIQFRLEREDSWNELEALLDRIDRSGIRSLGADDLMRLPHLYRAAVSSLSVARAISLDRNVVLYLEALVGRAYMAVYTRPRAPLAGVAEFLKRGFPRTVRRFAPHFAASVLILLAGALTGYVMVITDTERFYAFVSEDYAGGRGPEATTESLRDALYAESDDERSGLQLFSAFLFTHNAGIGLLAFALGFLAGAPTMYLMFSNGTLLGAFAALYASRGLGWEFWAWVLPHGITELGAVCLCGMCGLALGMAVVFPGEERRMERLAQRGREMASVAVTCVLLFAVAALIEGFFRQLVTSVPIRWVVASATLLFWAVYFTRAGRCPPERPPVMS